MRVKCRYCHRKAIITHSVELSDQVTELYVSCGNPHCGARTVVRLFYAHTITPPAETLLNSLHEQIAEMDPVRGRAANCSARTKTNCPSSPRENKKPGISPRRGRNRMSVISGANPGAATR